ncbi:hypothetical protein [Ureibacillus endophyticus]|uniref:Uncharacterized protein n=1 Tax=Ureibacillus endophyticus TaxID=1978490 RepID=A0A494Z1U1_9BACL|nr:hypothetical protein [Lysinibacillus endophyticus]RKQ16447.1 hypothetical protein D8M03_09670 [Lysinibacillus endophyticus]
MIHSVEILFPVEYEEVQLLLKRNRVKAEAYEKFGAVVKKLTQNVKSEHPGFAFTWLSSNGKGSWNIHLKVDIVKLLRKSDITEKDYQGVEAIIRKFLISQFGHSSHFDEHILTRIDYKLDVVIPNKNHEKLIFHLYEKYTERFRFKEKIKWGKDEQGKPLKYETSQYHKCKSVEFIIYSKEEERIAKGEEIQPYEKDVVRFELRLKNDHLNAMKRNDGKGKNRAKKLSEYFKEELYREYMINHVTPIIRKGDYYKITKAEKILDESNFSRKKKEKLRSFLVDISKNGIDSPKKYLSKPTFRRYLQDLESLGINPVLIPKNRVDFPSIMKNPFVL